MKPSVRQFLVLSLALISIPAGALEIACPIEEDPVPIDHGTVTVYFVGAGPRVTDPRFLDRHQDGEAHFSTEADFVGVAQGQPYACLEKATTLSSLMMSASQELAPGAILVPVRVQNCQGELFKDSNGADIDPMAVARWIQENAKSPSVVVFGFARSEKTPPLGDLIRTLRKAGVTVIPPAAGGSGEALVTTMLRAGREAGALQGVLRTFKTAACASNGGINQGGLPTGTYVSTQFPCDDTSKKNGAIQNLLGQLGYTQTLCSGTCTKGSCKATTLSSGTNDNVDLSLQNDGSGTCWYVATVTPPGTGYFFSDCGCVC
jgi:hypothetical protein